MPDFAVLPQTSIEPLVGTIEGYYAGEHTLSAEITSEPVEGSPENISDHAVIHPARLVLYGFQGDPSLGPSALERVNALLGEELVTVVTPRRIYENMVLVGVRHTESRIEGRGLLPELAFREVRIVGLDTAPRTSGIAALMPPALDRGVRQTTRLPLPGQPLITDLRTEAAKAMPSVGALRSLGRQVVEAYRSVQAFNRETLSMVNAVKRDIFVVTADVRQTARNAASLVDVLDGLETTKIDVSNDLNQTVRTVLGSRTKVVRVWRSQTDGQWYGAVDGEFAAVALQGGQPINGTLYRMQGPSEPLGDAPFTSGHSLVWDGDIK